MNSEIEGTLSTIQEKELISATVVGLSDKIVVLNIGGKSDGLINRTEFRDMKELEIGNVVEVYVENQEDEKGQLVLSRKKAKIVKAWENIADSHENDNVIEGFVKRRTRGG